MSSPLIRGRGSRAATLTAAASLIIGTASLSAVGTAPAQSAPPAPPAEDCATPFEYTTLAEGDLVHGLTVSQGTDPDPFTGEVLGPLEKVISGFKQIKVIVKG